MLSRFWALIVGALLLLSTPAMAGEKAYLTLPVWNEVIDQTNFDVAGHCSGTLINLEKRLVLTAHHCVSDNVTFEETDVETDGELKKKKTRKYEELTVSQFAYAGSKRTKSAVYTADIVAMDDARDLAVVKISADLPNTIASPVAAENPMRGEDVWIVGNPAMEYASMVKGNVANVHRQVKIGKTRDVLQVAGALISGNSGGPIYNMYGEIIGVAHATRGGFIGYVIPASEINKFLEANKTKLGE